MNLQIGLGHVTVLTVVWTHSDEITETFVRKMAGIESDVTTDVVC